MRRLGIYAPEKADIASPANSLRLAAPGQNAIAVGHIRYRTNGFDSKHIGCTFIPRPNNMEKYSFHQAHFQPPHR